MKIAILTSRLDQFAGSEIVAIEAAMHFSARGHTVTVQANKVSKDIFNIARGRFNLQTTPVEISDYDLIWSQHGQFLHNMANPNLLLNWRGAFISVHLSYYHPIETYHYPIAKRFSSLRVFNADVTRDLLDGSDQSPDALVVTSRKVVGLFLEQFRLQFVPVLHRLQGRLAAQG